jgi:hypothetical protein
MNICRCHGRCPTAGSSRSGSRASPRNAPCALDRGRHEGPLRHRGRAGQHAGARLALGRGRGRGADAGPAAPRRAGDVPRPPHAAGQPGGRGRVPRGAAPLGGQVLALGGRGGRPPRSSSISPAARISSAGGGASRPDRGDCADLGLTVQSGIADTLGGGLGARALRRPAGAGRPVGRRDRPGGLGHPLARRQAADWEKGGPAPRGGPQARGPRASRRPARRARRSRACRWRRSGCPPRRRPI